MSKPKTIVKFVVRLSMLPYVPILALGYWSATNLSYWQSVKEIWKGFL